MILGWSNCLREWLKSTWWEHAGVSCPPVNTKQPNDERRQFSQQGCPAQRQTEDKAGFLSHFLLLIHSQLSLVVQHH